MNRVAPPTTDDCFRPDAARLSHNRAIELLCARIVPLTATERLALADAAGRYVNRDISAVLPVPAHTNSAVDGYAYAQPARPPTGLLPIIGRSAAGHPFAGDVAARPSAVRVLTGGALPAGTDTVAMQEDCGLDPASPSHVVVPAGQKRGANVRQAGEDLAAGQTVITPGARLRPQDLAALAALGLGHVEVTVRPRIAIVATGDEVQTAGSGALHPAHVYDANSDMLAEIVKSAGGAVTHLGIWPDQRDVITERLAAAALAHDVILTTGGASMGDEDHIASSLATLGSRHFWQIAVKPGRPLLFGQIDRNGDRCLVVGLPGNPVAVFVCACLYVQPLLRALQGGTPAEPRRYKLPAAFAFAGRKRGRREFWRAMLVDTPQGLGVDKFKRDGSGLISGLMAADGLIDIPEDAGDVAVGDLVDFIPLTEFGIQRR